MPTPFEDMVRAYPNNYSYYPIKSTDYLDDVLGLPKTTLKTQVAGSHYKDMGIQPVEYINANKLNYFEGNVIKYVTRHRNKGGSKDIEKAIHYLQMILEYEYGTPQKDQPTGY